MNYMKLFVFGKGEYISVDSQSAVSPFVLKTPVKLKEWDGVNLEEDFVSDCDKVVQRWWLYF